MCNMINLLSLAAVVLSIYQNINSDDAKFRLNFSTGQVLDGKSRWRLSAIPELFWSFVNFIILL